jgi:calcium release-activated calcium channel protein 1
VKFWDVGNDNRGKVAALVATIILVPIILLFIAFAVHFYRKVVSYKYKRSARGLQELETMAEQLGTGHDTLGSANYQPSNILNI